MSTAKYEERRKQVMLGNLPDDFLRVSGSNAGVHNGRIATGGVQAAPATAWQNPWNLYGANVIGQLTVTISQGNLVKNYGITKMDPYVRLRVGHAVYETQTDIRGGKTPTWNKTFTTCLPQGIRTIHLEVYDEHKITPDERIAWAEFVLPKEVFNGKVSFPTVPLSGAQGKDKEGSLQISVYFTPVNTQRTQQMLPAAPIMVVPQPVHGHVPYYLPSQPVMVQQYPTAAVPMAYPAQQPVQQQQVFAPTEDDIKQIQEMFPSFDKEVVLGVLENCRGNKDQAINTLLSLSSDK